jgi:hypothetical protein
MDARGSGQLRESALVGAGINALHSGVDMRAFCSAPKSAFCSAPRAIGSASRHNHAAINDFFFLFHEPPQWR